MKVICDLQADILRIIVCNAPVERSDEGRSGVSTDYDNESDIVSLEALDVSMRVEGPLSMKYSTIRW